MRRRLRDALAVALTCCLAGLLAAAPAHASKSQESTFQDDSLLVYGSPQGQAHALDILKGLGVDRIRVSVFWKLVAPAPDAPTKPDFDAADPAAYPVGSWDRYDRILALARERGIGVNFDVTSPAPNWATGTPPRADLEKNFDPDANEFGLFLHALGTRYSGTYVAAPDTPPIGRVDYWSIWNEPNQPGWLTPQWGKDPRNPKQDVETAPRIYRALYDHAYESLVATGHQQDTILIGDTAPKGAPTKRGLTRALSPSRFIRQLYCLDDNLQFYKGTSAELRACPVSDQAATFVKAHPGLFNATGWAHHPYELTFSPTKKPADPESITIANLPQLSRLLRHVYQRYGQPIKGNKRNMPLYLTEFGYQTDPPDKLAVSLSKQAAFINQSDYIAWRNPLVRSVSQFLLVDDVPPPGVDKTSFGAYDSTFQSGLLFADQRHKPSYAAYAVPVYVARRTIQRGSKLTVWGQARAAPDGTPVRVTIEARGGRGSAYRKLTSVMTDKRGFLSKKLKPARSGALRLSWRDPSTTVTHRSRGVSFTVKPKAPAKRR